jgi:hypothetical protein
MFDEHSGSAAERETCSAYVIENDAYTTALVEALRGYVPLVTNSIKVSTDKGMALDKETGGPIKLWTVEVKEARGDNATAIVTWYQGNQAAEGLTLKLARQNGRWIVLSEHTDWIS